MGETCDQIAASTFLRPDQRDDPANARPPNKKIRRDDRAIVSVIGFPPTRIARRVSVVGRRQRARAMRVLFVRRFQSRAVGTRIEQASDMPLSPVAQPRRVWGMGNDVGCARRCRLDSVLKQC